MVEKEVRRHLSKSKLAAYHDRLVGFIARFYDPVGSTHANWKEARTDHDGI
jgi:hypothetical protein